MGPSWLWWVSVASLYNMNHLFHPFESPILPPPLLHCFGFPPPSFPPLRLWLLAPASGQAGSLCPVLFRCFVPSLLPRRCRCCCCWYCCCCCPRCPPPGLFLGQFLFLPRLPATLHLVLSLFGVPPVAPTPSCGTPAAAGMTLLLQERRCRGSPAPCPEITCLSVSAAGKAAWIPAAWGNDRDVHVSAEMRAVKKDIAHFNKCDYLITAPF